MFAVVQTQMLHPFPSVYFIKEFKLQNEVVDEP